MTERKLREQGIDASPVKSFFVTMLTRDISLIDSILDLLDNSVDGILRKARRSKTRNPYSGYSASIKFDDDHFMISDNCGGIPWDLHKYAFRMGRSDPERDKDKPTVGVYGIGMKRAIFKLGYSCLIQTQHNGSPYEVEITDSWMKDEGTWKLPVYESTSKMSADGTVIYVSELHDGIRYKFKEGKRLFQKELMEHIETHYSVIMDKGFNVSVNGDRAVPKLIRMQFDKEKERGSIRPFIYETTVDGVDVFMAIGFTRGMPSQEEINEEQEGKRYSSDHAGWTITCNDRVVAYCDKSALTGWGEAGVPKYHTQFIAISGIVEFKSDDASKLPTTTTGDFGKHLILRHISYHS